VAGQNALSNLTAGTPLSLHAIITGRQNSFPTRMVWGQLWSSKNPVKIIVQKANLEGITKLAEHFECRIKVEEHQESDSLVLTLTKTKPEAA
jgi:hypothetical protein